MRVFPDDDFLYKERRESKGSAGVGVDVGVVGVVGCVVGGANDGSAVNVVVVVVVAVNELPKNDSKVNESSFQFNDLTNDESTLKKANLCL